MNTMMHADFSTFVERAVDEAKRYGEDPWVFLRELVQNSRDAKAEHIDIRITHDGATSRLECDDDGDGMTSDDMQRYLLRLYASSKENNASAVGFFGVGFWSVLMIRPSLIRVQSRTRQGESCAFDLYLDGRIENIQNQRTHHGTTITLHHTQPPPNDLVFREALVAERLRYYAGHIRSYDGKGSLSLRLNGQSVNLKSPTPPFESRRFRTSHCDGVLGFGQTPSVRLYKGGILVRDLASLNDLAPRLNLDLPFSGWGLHPQVWLNMDGLDVLMDRRKVVEDEALIQTVQECALMLKKAHRRLLRKLAPLNLSSIWLKLRAKPFIPIAVMLVTVLLFSLWRLDPVAIQPTQSEPNVRVEAAVDSALDNWSGSLIDTRGGALSWSFDYQPRNSMLFQIGVLSRYDGQRGFFPERASLISDQPLVADDDVDAVSITMSMLGRRRNFQMPMRPDYAVIPNTITLDGVPLPVNVDVFGMATVLPTTDGVLRYRIAPRTDPRPPLNRTRFIVDWPPEWRERLRNWRALAPPMRIEAATEYLSNTFAYSRDPELARRFEEAQGPWLSRVLAGQGGDCDILNGLLTLVLREIGITADLVVGLIGENGRARSNLHAWVRYWDGRLWRTLDLTQTAENPRAPVTAAPPPITDTPERSTDTAQGSIPPPIETPTTQRESTSFPWWWLPPALILVTLGLKLHRRKPLIEQPQYFAGLIAQGMRRGQTLDGLWYRAFLPRFGGSPLSLAQVERRGNQETIWRADDARQAALAPPGSLVLDAGDGMHAHLDFLTPEAVALELLEGLVIGPPLFQTAAQKLHQLDPKLQLHFKPDADVLQEYVRGEAYHIVLGARHPIFVSATQAPKPDQTFELVRGLLEHTTLYAHQRDRFLATYAEELP